MSEADLFSNLQPESPAGAVPSTRPLADRMRPARLEDYQGQGDLVGPDSMLRRMIEADEIRSMLLWGPPGSGKTTLARLIAGLTRARFLALSAVTAGIKDIKQVIEEARQVQQAEARRVILFIDEIHRFNRVQQDALLPHVESGLVTLIGATTENPSFSVIAPLLSRCRVFTLAALEEEALLRILERALADEAEGLGGLRIEADEEVLPLIARMSDGDARRALNLLEMCVCSARIEADGSYRIDGGLVREVAQRRQYVYDASGEEHYNLISAFHKSLRGSDPQAAAYWCVRMLSGGEDPRYILRRMLVFASEDIGNADPRALQVAVAAREAYEALGQPEGEIPLMQAVVYLATAPKSNASYMALQRAREECRRSGSLPVPMVIRNAVTGLMKELGYGEGYQYDHDHADHFAPQRYLPEDIREAVFYEPGDFGFERDIGRRMAWWEARRREAEGRGEAPEPEAAPPRRGLKRRVRGRRRRRLAGK